MKRTRSKRIRIPGGSCYVLVITAWCAVAPQAVLRYQEAAPSGHKASLYEAEVIVFGLGIPESYVLSALSLGLESILSH